MKFVQGYHYCIKHVSKNNYYVQLTKKLYMFHISQKTEFPKRAHKYAQAYVKTKCGVAPLLVMNVINVPKNKLNQMASGEAPVLHFKKQNTKRDTLLKLCLKGKPKDKGHCITVNVKKEAD